MKNYFSSKLYIQGLKKIKVSGIAFSLIVVLLNAILPIIAMAENNFGYYSNRIPEAVDFNMVAPFDFLLVVLVPIIAHDMFSFLNERNQSDFYHAVPYKRTCVYFSFTVAILTWAFGTIIDSSLINSVLWSMARWYTLSFSTILFATLPYLVLSVMMAGVMILAMTVTGTKISNFLVAILFLLFFRVMSVMFVYSVDEVSTLMNIDYGIMSFFKIDFFLPVALLLGVFDGDAMVYTNVWLQIYSLIVGLGFIGIGAYTYNIRRSEAANKSAPNKIMQHIYRFAVTLPFVFLICALIMMDGFDAYQLVFIIIALLVYVLYELITTKKIKNVIKSLPLLAIPVAVAGLLTVSVFAVANSVDNMDIDSEDIDSYSFYGYFSSYEDINVKDVFVSNAEASEIIAEAYEDKAEGEFFGSNKSYVYQKMLIKLRSGRIIARNMYFWEEDYQRLSNILKNDIDYRESYLRIPSAEEIEEVWLYKRNGASDQDDLMEIYESFCEEYFLLSYEDKMLVKNPKGDTGTLLQLMVRGNVNSKDFYSYYYLDNNKFPKTVALYFENINASIDMTAQKARLKNVYEELALYEEQGKLGKISEVYGSINLSAFAGRFSDGSYSIVSKHGGVEMISALREVIKVILDNEKSFVYTVPENICEFNYYIDITAKEYIISSGMFGTDETTSLLRDHDFVSSIVVEPDSYGHDPMVGYYANDDMYINIDSSMLLAIAEIIQELETVEISK